MKKTFILFMAMVVALALSAAPQIKLAQLSTMPQNELLAHTPQQTKALQRIRLDANKRIAPHNNAVPANKTAAAEQKHVLQNLQKERSGKTTILIAHRISTIEQMDKIVYIDDGKIVAVGTHEELLKTCPSYEAMAELQKLEAEK